MNIGINLAGISLHYRNRDWKRTKESITQQIINCWEPHNVMIYTTTYDSIPSPNELNELLHSYKPKKHKFLGFQDQRLTYKQSLELMLGEELDFIISTRFDIIFNSPLSSYNIKFDKFNFLFKEGNGYWEKDKFTCDNLFCFPAKYLQATIDSINEFYVNPYRECCSDLHPLYRYIVPKIGEENTHFIFDEIHLSGTGAVGNPYYKLDRYD
jgi:hypothetical protein